MNMCPPPQLSIFRRPWLFYILKCNQGLTKGLTVPHNAFVNYVVEIENIFVAQKKASFKKQK